MQIYAVLRPAVYSSRKSVNMNGLKRHKKNGQSRAALPDSEFWIF